MRIRLAITLDIRRRPRDVIEEMPPHDVIEGGAFLERAEPQRIGFDIPPSIPDERR